MRKYSPNSLRGQFETPIEYRNYLARKKGFESFTDQQKHLAIKKGYSSLSDYKRRQAETRRQRPLNQKLSSLIEARLSYLGKDTKRFADELQVSVRAAQQYRRGIIIPRKDLQPKFFEALGMDYKTIDDLLE